jgi:serine/threonine protein kinase
MLPRAYRVGVTVRYHRAVRGGDLCGTVLDGRYRLVERLAEGAMGVVYRGVSLAVDRAVAVKLMHASLPDAMAARERFQREAKLMALVDHPHCVSVIDYGVQSGKPFLVMELVRGRSLHDMLVEQRRFDRERAVDIIRQILSGLAYAHDQGIIHRDIKPANVMVTPKAPLGVHVRILDFGLARLREASSSLTDGMAVGTPSYMAPEQCRGDKLDVRVDIYACGVVLFELLSGRKPFVASDPIEIVKLQLNAAPPRLCDVAGGNFGELEAVIARALAKSPAERYSSAVAMSEAIDAALAGVTAPERTATLLGSGDLVPSSSVDVPITVGSSVIDGAAVDSHHESRLSRLLPVSRMRYLVLACLVVAGAVVYALVVTSASREPQAVRDAAVAITGPTAPVVVDPTEAPRAQAAALAIEGKLDAALDVLAKARKQYPDRAVLAFEAGKLHFAKLWWADGIKDLRDAIKLDASYRRDPELVRLVVRGFITTPEYDDRLGSFLLELGDAAQPALDETARTHPNPVVRARAAEELRRSKH